MLVLKKTKHSSPLSHFQRLLLLMSVAMTICKWLITYKQHLVLVNLFYLFSGAWTLTFAFLIWSANDLFVAMFRNSQIFCNATTDISGDIPESAGELSQYEKVIETLTTLFPVWVSPFLLQYSMSNFSNFLVCSLRVC